ncbi:MAG: endopeptidase La [Deferribacteres bacterium]|nr:endopeptidase La [candidate division KSB1 bacterium]MCB9504058.1 endopeptidase La [Deferribacteres bacterium]
METVLRNREEFLINSRLPVLPLKEVVVFPYMIFPLLVGREPSLRAVQEAMLLDKFIFLTAQKDVQAEEPLKDDLYRVGVVARIIQVLKLPNGLMKVLIEGVIRAKITRFLPVSDHFEVKLDFVEDEEIETPDILALTRKTVAAFKDYVQLHPKLPDEILLALEGIVTPARAAHYISCYVHRDVQTKQQILEEMEIIPQLELLLDLLTSECEILKLEQSIDQKVRDNIQWSQKKFYLQEQMRVIKEELGDEPGGDGELAKLHEKITKAGMPEDAENKALEELNKLKSSPPISPESSVIRNYLDWMISVPWDKKTRDRLDLKKAVQMLDEDHYGLKKPKERIVEHLAVLKLVKKLKGPILCLVGPPGVGKTSLGKSIARAMGRNFVRISLGGVRDEAEIRGHRRTYIGSMPGRIIQSMKKAKSVNPVFLLDEIDKMSQDFRGDPASALLEVLDPEQNRNFNDHYLEVDYDLSNVMFITTANVRGQIPRPLQDRMEIIELPGYLEFEKLAIAENFLIPKVLEAHGLTNKKITFSRQAIQKIMHEYTREAGVRELERNLSSISRKIAKDIAGSNGRSKAYRVTPGSIQKYLGLNKFTYRKRFDQPTVGEATGLAWTRYGGDVLEIEVNIVQGKGDFTLTGKLGDVMKESAKAALSYIRSRIKELKIEQKFWKDSDIHIHFPEGAIPKDGPSAGITIAVAVVSALTKRKVNRSIAMTGEITLRGKVLAIGGLNEKILAAQRFGIEKVLIPKENENDLKDLPPELRRGIKIIQVSHMDEVLEQALID